MRPTFITVRKHYWQPDNKEQNHEHYHSARYDWLLAKANANAT